MEGLSAAASGITVGVIAVQLAERIKMLSDFWNSMKEAPEDIRAISLDLKFLSSVLTQIAHEAHYVEPDETLLAILDTCSFRAKTLVALLNEIEPGFSSTSVRVRKWTAFKATLKNGQVMKFKEALERVKSTLILAQQNHSR